MNYLIEPWAHQLEGQKRAMATPGLSYGLFFEPGCGKTGALINILREMFNKERRIMRTLILCPPIVINNWKNEFKLHSKIDQQKIILLKGKGITRRRDMIQKCFSITEDGPTPMPSIVITNYETLSMDVYELFEQWEPEIFVFDESHYLKTHKSKRSKKAFLLANPKGRKTIKYLLTGTPILNSPTDIFQQFKIMDGGETFSTNFYGFRAKYLIDRNAGMPRANYYPKWEAKTLKQDGVSSYDMLSDGIFKKAMMVKKVNCLDLPPFTHQKLTVDMTSQQKTMYQEMKRDFITYVDGEACVATLALTKGLRMLQICSGFYKTEKGEEIDIKNNPKERALEDLLSGLLATNKVIIWAVYKRNYEHIARVCNKLKIKAVAVHGGISEKEKKKAVDSFNKDPKVRVFYGHPASGGIGINLVAASYSIFYSRNFSLGESLQAEARNYRGGSEIHKKITRIDLAMKGSIDELVMEKLSQKIDMSTRILTDLTHEIKNRYR